MARVELLREIIRKECHNKSIRDVINAVPKNHWDEIIDSCYLGDFEIATNKTELRRLGITHVLNAAKGEKFSQVNTDQAFYDDCGIAFFGCSLMDVDQCKIERHFDKAAEFIDEALSSKGRILVHCYMGVSRSAAFVLAFMVRYRGLSLEEAVRITASKRLIWPNTGFLLKLIAFEEETKAKKVAASSLS